MDAIKKIGLLILHLESKVIWHEKKNIAISHGSIGWHIAHSLLVINNITKVLLQSNPQEYKWKFNIKRILVLMTAYIPRGKTKAPRVVQPNKEITADMLLNQIKIAKENFINLTSLHSNSFFTHYYYGQLNKKSTLRFLHIHTSHHLRIINDIAAS